MDKRRYKGIVTHYNRLGRVGTTLTIDHAGGISIVKLLKRPSEVCRMFGVSDLNELLGKSCVIEFFGVIGSVRQYKFIEVSK